MQYQIMHKDQVIAYAEDDRITKIVRPELCPHCFAEGMPLTRWLDDRMIDTHRSHSRKVYKALRLRPGADADELLTVGHAVTITDNWWIQRMDESCDYRSLKGYNQEIADFAQFGALNVQNNEVAADPKFRTESSFGQSEPFSAEESQKSPVSAEESQKRSVIPKSESGLDNQFMKELHVVKAEDIDPNVEISAKDMKLYVKGAFFSLNNKPDTAIPDSQQTDVSVFSGTAVQRGERSGYSELGTTGSFEKAWRWHSGAWYMYKQGDLPALISEYYSFKFLKAMHINAAEYFIRRTYSSITGLESLCIVTKDFTDNATFDFEPFSNYYYDNEEPDYILERLPEKCRRDYVMMLFYDVLLLNSDRHNQNVGFLRNSETGELIGLAPYFDYNIALAATTESPYIDPETGNSYSEPIMSNELCRSILRENLPERAQIEQAVRFAADEAQKAFYKERFRYQPYEDYILQAYDYFASHLK